MADSAPVVDVENLVQPLRGCVIELQFGSAIQPSELIDGPNADDGRSDGGVLEHPRGRDDVLGFPELATKPGEVPELAILGTDPDPVLGSASSLAE